MAVHANQNQKNPQMNDQNTPTTPQAQFLIALDDGATLLCARHAVAFQQVMSAAGSNHDIYELDADEDPVVCQACHLSDLSRPQIILPH